MGPDRTVLIVEPDDATARTLQSIVAEAGWKALHAADAEMGLRMLGGYGCTLVLTELDLPGIDGFELLARIREACPETLVVPMTAGDAPGSILGSIREHAFAYLGKPVTPEALAEILRMAEEACVAPDDIEVISLRPDWVSLRVRCKQSIVERLTPAFRRLAADLEPEECGAVATAFRELLLNAIEHGGRSDPAQKVVLTYIRGMHSIVYYVRDPGEGFSPDDLPHAAVSNTPDDPFRHVGVRRDMGLRPGGFGILLSRKLADELLYSEKGNEVLLIKYLDRDA